MIRAELCTYSIRVHSFFFGVAGSELNVVTYSTVKPPSIPSAVFLSLHLSEPGHPGHGATTAPSLDCKIFYSSVLSKKLPLCSAASGQ